jgi:cytochrome P450
MTDRLDSLMGAAEREPWGYYDELLAVGGDGWDEGMNAYVIASYAGCKHVLQNDKRLFHHPAQDAPVDDVYRLTEGRMQVTMMGGEDQTRVHNWWVHEFQRKNIEAWRESLIRPLVNSVIDRFAGRGHAELATELVDPIPIRIISAVLGLPWQDDELMDHLKRLLRAKLEYSNRARPAHISSVTAPVTPEEQAEITRRFHEVADELNALVLPSIVARREDRQDDVISHLWNDGPSLLEQWGEEEMCSAVRVIMFGGSDTTTHAICNGLRMLLTQPGLADEVSSRGEPGLMAFTEEMLRLGGSVHFRGRVANEDLEVNGVKIAKDEPVIILNAAANRDPNHYERPLEIDLDRPAPRDHLAFNFGPRYCVGAPLARAEIQETIRGALERLPRMRLDPNAAPPRLDGFLTRGYRPLHALFDA